MSKPLRPRSTPRRYPARRLVATLNTEVGPRWPLPGVEPLLEARRHIASSAIVAVLCLLSRPASPAVSPEPLVTYGDFEAGSSLPDNGWTWWSRTDHGSAAYSDKSKSGERSARLTHDGPRDWAFHNRARIDAAPDQEWRASAWVKCEDTDEIELAVVALAGGETLRWDIGSDSIGGTHDWTQLEAWAAVPQGCDQIYVRFIGSGDTSAWVDGVTLEQTERPARPRKPSVNGWAVAPVRERLGRSLVAVPAGDGAVYVGWRLLAGDPSDVAFNVYRAGGDGAATRLNTAPVSRTTDFVDTTADASTRPEYWIRRIEGTTEGPDSRHAVVDVAAHAGVDGAAYLAPPLDGDHTFQKAGIADLDSDGEYDYVLKQPNANVDPYVNYWEPSPGTYKLEAYKGDGTFLWRRDLGWSIEQGIWYSPYVVYDFDGDGRAEVAVKTGEGDPRDPDGRVQSGPEYLSILDGLTGDRSTRIAWPSREGYTGQSGYNYSSRNQLGVAFLDGKTPSLLVARGTYTLMKLTAYEFHGGALRELWTWTSREEGGLYRGQGAHFMHTADVDGDGRDEVILGSSVIDDNGQGLWSTGMGHPDHCYVGDIDTTRPGLEIYYGMETAQLRNGVSLVDARTGELIWGLDSRTRHVHNSGLCADLDAEHPGMECYSGERDEPGRWLHSARGELLADETAWDVGLSPRAVHWDADPQRELIHKGRIRDYDGDTDLGSIQGRQIAWADILGDWREEIVTTVAGELRIYTTTIPASDRRACLMQDRLYRADVAHLAMGYAQPPMSPYFGATAPEPGPEAPPVTP